MKQTRRMDWNTEGELINELHWLGSGNDGVLLPDGTTRPLTEQERAGAAGAVEALIEQSHEEPDYDIDYDNWTEEQIDAAEEEQSAVEVTLPTEMWELIDALCVGVDFGDGVGVVGTRVEVVR